MKKQHLFLGIINLLIIFAFITNKSILSWASEKNPTTAHSLCLSSLSPPSEQKQYMAIEAFIELSHTIEDDSAGSIFILFANTYLDEDIESFMGPDWQKDITKYTQSWKKQDAIDFLGFLAEEIGTNETLDAIKSASGLRWIRHNSFRDKMHFLEQYLSVNKYKDVLKRTSLKSFAPNNVKGIKSNVGKVENIIGKAQTVQLIEEEDNFTAFTVINTEIDNIERYLREDRNIPTKTVHGMIARDIRAFMNASLHYLQARLSYIERISDISRDDVNQMMIDYFPAFTENYFTYNRSPLHIAVYAGDTDLATSLIDNKVDSVNVKDIEGWTPLHVASYTGNKNLASLLIKKGADVNKVDRRGLTPLDVATYAQNIELVSLLISSGTSKEISATFQGSSWTPFYWSPDAIAEEIISFLKENNYHPDASLKNTD